MKNVEQIIFSISSFFTMLGALGGLGLSSAHFHVRALIDRTIWSPIHPRCCHTSQLSRRSYPWISTFLIPSKIVNNPTYSILHKYIVAFSFFSLDKTHCTGRCPKVFIDKHQRLIMCSCFEVFHFLHNPLMWLLCDLQRALEFS